VLPLRPLVELGPAPAPRLDGLAPPPRFTRVSFESFRPQHPTQATALEHVRSFVEDAESGIRNRRGRTWPWTRRSPGRGLYLDGGFGVGKTHLLAAAYFHADLDAKLYLSFQELVYLIGVLGMARATAELGGARLLLVDEFELDDPGNTLIVKSFLNALADAGGYVVTTSNTPPEAQGRGRFNAEDFRREIQSLADRFDTRTMDGPDYRHRAGLAAWPDRARFERSCREEDAPAPRVFARFDELLALLEGVHPSRYDGLLRQIGTLYLTGVRTLATQNDALRFVHFVDKLYDLGVGLRAVGDVPLEELFHASYRDSAYAKKHLRCLSRLSELLHEADAPVGGTDAAGGDRGRAEAERAEPVGVAER